MSNLVESKASINTFSQMNQRLSNGGLQRRVGPEWREEARVRDSKLEGYEHPRARRACTCHVRSHLTYSVLKVVMSKSIITQIRQLILYIGNNQGEGEHWSERAQGSGFRVQCRELRVEDWGLMVEDLAGGLKGPSGASPTTLKETSTSASDGIALASSAPFKAAFAAAPATVHVRYTHT